MGIILLIASIHLQLNFKFGIISDTILVSDTRKITNRPQNTILGFCEKFLNQV
jgi:hypothetical protein